MKALRTKEYFEKHKEELFERYGRECDYEHDLAIMLPDFSTLPKEAREKAEAIVTKMYAEKVATIATETLLKKMRTIRSIKEGKASLGYISMTQEVRAWHDLNEGFEFSCFMLAEFKKRHDIA